MSALACADILPRADADVAADVRRSSSGTSCYPGFLAIRFQPRAADRPEYFHTLPP